ncbi:MAG: uroporphyrinogen decarboxylase family protein [Planctomycetota bacterium]|nr:uroporphyrinogen decarboxylase family protein [Planctomycetota bacterium]
MNRRCETTPEIFLSVSEEMHFSALTVPGFYWEIAPGVPAYYWLAPEGRFRQIEIIRDLAPPGLMLVGVSGGVMGMPAANEYVEFSYKMFDAPEEIDQRARKCLEEGLQTARRLGDCGVEAIVTASDIADNRGPFFGPEQMDRFVLPYLREWSQRVKEMRKYAILHTDGNIMPCLEQIAETYLDALQAIDPTAGMDMRTVRRQVGGRLCPCGNIDCGLLLTGAPQAVYDATRDLLIDCKAGGGLVLGASNAVQSEVPTGNYRGMIQAWIDHGKYHN